MFFTFSLPTKAIFPLNYISRKNPDNHKGPIYITVIAQVARDLWLLVNNPCLRATNPVLGLCGLFAAIHDPVVVFVFSNCSFISALALSDLCTSV